MIAFCSETDNQSVGQSSRALVISGSGDFETVIGVDGVQRSPLAL